MTEQKRVFDAISTGDARALQQVINSNPQLADTRDDRGLSAVMVAQYMRRPDLVAILLGGEPGLEIHEAAALGMTRRVKRILMEEAPLAESHSVDGYTPLHLACMFGHAETARAMLEHGVQINAPADNPSRAQPLHVAVAGGWPAVVTLLLEQGAAVDARQRGGFTPLHLAVQSQDGQIVRLLLEHGANPDEAADDGRSPQDLAEETGSRDVRRALRGPFVS